MTALTPAKLPPAEEEEEEGLLSPEETEAEVEEPQTPSVTVAVKWDTLLVIALRPLKVPAPEDAEAMVEEEATAEALHLRPGKLIVPPQ